MARHSFRAGLPATIRAWPVRRAGASAACPSRCCGRAITSGCTKSAGHGRRALRCRRRNFRMCHATGNVGGWSLRRDADAQPARPWRRCVGGQLPDGRSRRGRVAITRFAPPARSGARRPLSPRRDRRGCGWGRARGGRRRRAAASPGCRRAAGTRTVAVAAAHPLIPTRSPGRFASPITFQFPAPGFGIVAGSGWQFLKTSLVVRQNDV
jgi:hypothetical protein